MDEIKKGGKGGMVSWASWKSPVGLGIFLLGASVALYIVLTLGVGIVEALHPSNSVANDQQLQQELQQAASQQTPSTGSAMPTTAQ